MDELIAFVHARLDDDEWWAREASRRLPDGFTPTGEHWRWECETTDQPIKVDPVLDVYLEGENHSSVGLRSVEEYPSTVGAIPHLVIGNQDEIEAVVAGHVARHDPAHVLLDVQARRKTLVRCQEEMLSGIPRLVHFAKMTVWEMAQRWEDHDDFDGGWRP